MSELDTGIIVAGIIAALIIVMWSWKSVKTSQFNMEAARSRRMSQVRAARGGIQTQPQQIARNDVPEAVPEWIYPLLERLGIDEIPESEPAGLSEALDKYAPLIQPFLKGLTEGAQQQQGAPLSQNPGFL
jgi:hypothetical protein